VAGFARGEAVVDGIGEDLGHQMSIQFQNENLVATKDGTIVASVPDLITMVEEETGEPITTEGLRYGFRIKVVAMSSHPHWRTAAALKVVGPQYFGYDGEFIPVEERRKG
jgi:DUF917 family protein